MITAMDWMTMGTSGNGASPPGGEPASAAARIAPGVSEALLNAYRGRGQDVPEEFRRLLARLR